MTRADTRWDSIFGAIRLAVRGEGLPSVSAVAQERADPYRILVSTMISLRTKDEVTTEAARRLLRRAPTPERLAGMKAEAIARLIYPAGFYRTKAEHLKRVGAILSRDYGGRVPGDMEKLLALPGVGRKTANLVLSLGFGVAAICVDTHVHRISNRMGWVAASTPLETEKALMRVLPQRYWIPVNELLVGFGKLVCTPVSPRCSVCPVRRYCRRVGVTRHR